MKVKFSGRVHFANGDPAPGVVVRVFDEDASGKGDDDLTVAPGFTDAQGHFDLTYEPMRYLDYHASHASDLAVESSDGSSSGAGLRLPDLGDLYLPYLRFDYTFNGYSRQHTARMGLFQTVFHLLEIPPVDFLPSRDGFRFTNNFPGYFLPFSTPAFMASRKVPASYGLCGGMCAAAYDLLLAGKAIPTRDRIPKPGTRLQRYLFRRQIDSLGGLGAQVIKVAQWTSLPDGTPLGTWKRTLDEFSRLRQKLEDKNPVVLALIYTHASSLAELARQIFTNHQVLACACQQEQDGRVTIQVYDPNLPGRDDVTLHCEEVALGDLGAEPGQPASKGLKSSQWVGGQFLRDVRGFFAMPYTPVRPPDRLA